MGPFEMTTKPEDFSFLENTIQADEIKEPNFDK